MFSFCDKKSGPPLLPGQKKEKSEIRLFNSKQTGDKDNIDSSLRVNREESQLCVSDCTVSDILIYIHIYIYSQTSISDITPSGLSM